MNVNDVFERLRFATRTVNDLSGKTLQDLISNYNLNMQLKFALDKYAQYTKSIEDIYSLPIDQNTPYITPPLDALRSESYRGIIVFINQRAFFVSVEDLNNVSAYFPIRNVAGITSWAMPWGNLVYLFPNISQSYHVSHLGAPIGASDTTIYLDTSDTNYSQILLYNGRVTVGTEKILYQQRTNNALIGCTRGAEATTAAAWPLGTQVKENNMHLFYRRKHFQITFDESTDALVSPASSTLVEIPDEHMEVIIDYTAYKVLSKFDVERANFYKIDFDKWLDQARYEVQKGRAEVKKAGDIRGPYFFEEGLPTYGLTM